MEISGTAIILAGGKSSRMGEDKGLMLLDGKPMIQWVIETATQVTDQLIIITNQPNYEQFGYPTFNDFAANKGPLAGIITGLTESKTENNWILTCDSPFITVELLQTLMQEIKSYDAVIPVYHEKKHPLIAVYRKTALKLLQEQVALNHLKVMGAVEKLNFRSYYADQFEAINFKNINSKEDL